jgi:hypothetical protein
MSTKGLMTVHGDRMTYIITQPGGERPTSFDSAPGQFLTKVTLRRVR